jgi:hypothetical protein
MADQSYGARKNHNGSSSYGAAGGANPSSADPGGLRRRTPAPSEYPNNNDTNTTDTTKLRRNRHEVVQKLDFMFPKVDQEFTVKTKGGGVASLVASGLIAVLILAEIITWVGQNRMELSKTYVDNSLGKKMKVNLNVTFPALACEDLHVDVIDVAGDSQIDIDDTLVKRKLLKTGQPLTQQELEVETNMHRQQQLDKERILKSDLPADYCGPCYGAHETEGQCCQTCEEVIDAYKKKKWKTEMLKFTSEQCMREGRDKQAPKRITFNQGCNLAGYMTLNRVAGNFHIAMGEGVERDGRHIHTYVPEDAPNYNVSHIIHQLSFGPEDGSEPLSGMKKIVTEKTGTTGLFQYFIKIVPTSYVGDAFPNVQQRADSLPSLYEEIEEGGGTQKKIETNRYFITERFMPLMTDLLEDHHKEKDDPSRHAVNAGHAGSHAHEDHHKIQNSVLPGVFFIYEIYPFAVEISRNSVPFTHLLIRIMATVGGVFTLARWADSIIYDRRSTSR